VARNARQKHAHPARIAELNRWVGPHEVEVRDLAVYEEIAA
jgi:hypothetical protein